MGDLPYPPNASHAKYNYNAYRLGADVRRRTRWGKECGETGGGKARGAAADRDLNKHVYATAISTFLPLTLFHSTARLPKMVMDAKMALMRKVRTRASL